MKKKRIRGTPEQRFKFFCLPPDSNGCIRWNGGIINSGYGHFHIDRTKQVLAHRFSYELAKGAIPNGMEIDHLCRVLDCVNPLHLEAVTSQENHRRFYIIKTACSNGHEFNRDNTRLVGNRRWCRVCDRERYRRLRHSSPQKFRGRYKSHASGLA